MIDIHCHILNEIDDGSRSFNESIDLIKKAVDNGITDIVITPHYIRNTKYNANNLKKEALLQEIKQEINKQKININLYLGNEIYVDDNILELINEKEVKTLNNSKYVLIELPIRSELQNMQDIIFNLIKNDYIPIIAHPERYVYIQKDLTKINDYIEMGALMQGDYQSLFKKYGTPAYKTLKKLLKDNKIIFLASDIHRSTEDYNQDKLQKLLKKIVKNKDLIENLLITNPKKIINNEEM